MKHIIAHKVKDGWLVQIVDTRHLLTKSDVLKTIKQEGLEIKTQLFNNTYVDYSIYAD